MTYLQEHTLRNIIKQLCIIENITLQKVELLNYLPIF